MKEFNLELAKEKHPVQTRDGKPVRIICFDANNTHPIVALVTINNLESIIWYYLDGRRSRTEESDLDLFMSSKEREGWVNIYKNDVNTICSQIFGNEADANRAKDTYTKFLVTKKIEWEE